MTREKNTLLRRLGKRAAAFYFVEREGIAFDGTRELVASVARWLKPGSPFDELPDVLPIWIGSYIPFQLAWERWAFPDVFVVAIGCSSAANRRALVAHVRANPPLGMFDLDADADAVVRERPLPLHGFVIPGAVIWSSASGRRFDRETLVDMIGFADDEEAAAFEFATDGIPGEPDRDRLGPMLLKLLARGAGRKVPGARASDGYEGLVDHAFELFGLGAVSASGSVGGVAFEQLMRAAVEPSWLAQQQQKGHVALNNVIARALRLHRVPDGRLRSYQSLRNDLAHRLGDQPSGHRSDEELYDEVRSFLTWLARQHIDVNGAAVLVDVAPDPAASFDDLLREARTAGDAAASTARTSPMKIGTEVFEPFGNAWVVVRDPRRAFPKWLIDQGHASRESAGARFAAPGTSFERNLAWAHACAERLRSAGYEAHYGGRPD